MGNARSTFDKLQDRLWMNRYVPVRVKCQVYRAVVLTALTVYQTHVTKLDVYLMRQFRSILNITWKKQSPTKKILSFLACHHGWLIEKSLRWLDPVHSHKLCEDKWNSGKPRWPDGKEQQAIELCGKLPLGLNHRTVIVKPTDCKEKEM